MSHEHCQQPARRAHRAQPVRATGPGLPGLFEAEILELVPSTRIAGRWGFAGPDREKGPVYDSRLTVTLREAPGGGTLLTLVHERLDDLAAALPQVAAKVGSGWDGVLTKLDTLLAGTPL
jgi:uncharacterized protein YndB with AHSA1/START domain